MATFFNQFFDVSVDDLDIHEAFNVTLINDLPLFIDPFLLFNSKKPEYQKLHKGILKYMVFLRDAVAEGRVNDDLEKAWFYFPEVKQNWLGFSLRGNGGTGFDLPLTFHPAAIRASANFAPIGAGGATADLRSWSGLRSGSAVAEILAAKATGVR